MIYSILISWSGLHFMGLFIYDCLYLDHTCVYTDMTSGVDMGGGGGGGGGLFFSFKLMSFTKYMYMKWYFDKYLGLWKYWYDSSVGYWH